MTEHSQRGTAEALLLAWVAWEGLKYRVLVAGLAQHGYQVQHIYEALEEFQTFSKSDYESLFCAVFGKNPQNCKGVGTKWKSLEEFRVLRHRYVHGLGSASPKALLTGTTELCSAVEDAKWLAGLIVPTEDGPLPLGDPYRRIGSKRKTLSKRELHALLQTAGLKKRR